MIMQRLEVIVKTVFGGNVSQAATAADVPIPTLHRILDGSVESPRIGTLRKLADAYGVPLSWIMGDTSTQQAQNLGAGIPEPVWLIMAYHLRRQNTLRRKIAEFGPNTPEGRRLKRDFSTFNFLPFSAEEPLVEALDHLSIHLDPASMKDLAVIRQWSDLSTQFLEVALQKLKATQTK